MAIAVVTGGSRGLGLALSRGLVANGWSVVLDARDADAVAVAESELRSLMATGQEVTGQDVTGQDGTGQDGTGQQVLGQQVVGIVGDIADADHRRAVLAAAAGLGSLDLLVNNASMLGPSPQPGLASYPLDVWRRVYEVNVVAPLALIQEALPSLRRSARGRIVNVTSDASVEPYEGWGGYGSSKAALDQLTCILGAEEPALRVWAVDPGDMRTQMHQEAFPGEDISDRPEPASVVPALLRLITSDVSSGRVRAAELAKEEVAS